MAARREHGAPSALTVLEVAEGLRWTDPALGASLAEHVRRLAADDPTVRAAADRSVVRSLADSDRHEDVVERGVPLLAEARSRGDRDDGAAVLVELAAAATGLGDAGLARRLLDRLGPVSDLPARIGAVASAARAEACAAEGDVAGTDAAGDVANPLLFRVPQPDSAVVRARVTLARGIARRRAGDVHGALSALGEAISSRPADDVDGGRRSLLAAAEEIELLVEAGRHDEARTRAGGVLPEGAPGTHIAGAVGRIRLALAATSEQATTVAEDLEATGRAADAARAWELAAEIAEAEGELGQALSALRRGHGLASRARDASDRALRALGSVVDGVDPLAPVATASDVGSPAAANGTGPTRRRERARDTASEVAEAASPERDAAAVASDGPAPASWTSSVPEPHPVATEVPAREADASRAVSDVPPPPAAPSAGDRMPAPEPARRSSTRDELAELLASLTRSVDSSRASASAMGLEPAPPVAAAPSEAAPARENPVEEPQRTAEPEAERRSRHSAFAASPPPSETEPASRPTFDAFSTAPLQRITDDGPASTPAPVAPLPDDRFAPVADAAPGEGARVEDAGMDAVSRSVSSLLDPPGSARPEEPAVPSSAEIPTGAADTGDPGQADDSRSRATPSAAGTDAAAGLETARTPGPTGTGATDARASGSTVEAIGADRTTGVRDTGLESASTGSASAGPRATNGRPSTTAQPDPSPARNGTSGSNGSDPGERAQGAGRDGGTPDRSGDRAPTSETGRSVPPSTSRGDDDARTGLVAPGAGPRNRPAPSANERAPGTRPADEYEEELALTLATVLGEYHLPDVPVPPRRDRDRGAAAGEPPSAKPPAADVAVPSARRHTSGSMPVPGEQRWSPRPEASAGRPGGEPDAGRPAPTAGGRGRPPESGARLADLLAEAMDAFRHVGPEAQDGARGPGVGSRRA